MDPNATKRLAKIMAENRDTVLEHWSAAVRDSLRGRLTSTELGRQLEELFSALQSALDRGDLSLDASDLGSLLAELSRSRARQGFSATETAVSVFAVKDALLSPVTAADAQALADYAAFSSFVDKLGLFTFETYVNARDALVTEQSEQLLELSTPVVKLWDGVVAVPLIGTLDSARSQVVMERLLQALVDTGSPYAILDITGVPAVDTQVAQHILKTVVAAQLMGARVHHLRHPPADRADDRVARHRVRRDRHEGEPVRRAAVRPARQRRPDRPPSADLGAVGGARMDRVPVLTLGDVLLVSIQVDLEDQLAIRLQEDLAERIVTTGAHGVIIDITALDIVDSFVGRMLATIAAVSKVLDAETVVVGMRPAVAITLVELGLPLRGIRTALNVELGLRMLRATRRGDAGSTTSTSRPTDCRSTTRRTRA